MSERHTPRRRLRQRGVLMAAAAAAVSLVLSACAAESASVGGGSGSSAAPTASSPGAVKVNIEIYPGSFYTFLPYLAAAKGFFAENGINANIQPITGGGSAAFAALANGGSDVAMGDLTLAGPLLEKGVGLTAISGTVESGWELVAPKASTLPATFPQSVQALKGKNVGVVGLGTSSYFYLQRLAGAAGIGTNGVTYQALGGVVTNAVSALQANRVAGAMVSPDVAYYLTQDLGAHLVFDLNNPTALHQAGGELASTAGTSSGWLWARNDWLNKNPGVAKKFQLAMAEADVWAHNPANLSELISLLNKGGGLAKFEQGAGAAKFFKYALPKIISYVPAGSAGVYSKFWREAGVLKENIPSSKWFSPTIPTSAGQVLQMVRAAGKSSLGNSA